MSKVTFQGSEVNTSGSLPKVGEACPDFKVVDGGLAEVSLKDFAGKKLVISIFPSVDTGVCAASVRRFHVEAGKLGGATVLCVSKDLPFALGRFCAAEGIDNVKVASDFRYGDVASKFGVGIADSALKGLLSRAIVVVDEKGTVVHSELVPEITTEPNYDAVLSAVK